MQFDTALALAHMQAESEGGAMFGIADAEYADLITVMREATVEADRKESDKVKLATLYSIAARFYRDEAARLKYCPGLSQLARLEARRYEDKVIDLANEFEHDAQAAQHPIQ